MNSRIKKTLIIAASIGIPVAIVASTSYLYFNSPTVDRISKKGIFTFRVNSTLNNEGYKYDLSSSYGGPTPTNTLTQLVNNEILHLKSSGEFKYQQPKYDDKGQIVEHGRVIQPSYESYSFANADSIVLTFIDINLNRNEITPEFINDPQNKDKVFQLIFNSDDDSIIPDKVEENKFVLLRDSEDPRSINNSKVFGKIVSSGYLGSKIDLDTLDKKNPNINTETRNFILAGMGVTFNSGAKWVDSNGKQTKYDICAEDMFYSGLRTWLFDKEYRRKNGGSQELDKYFINKTQTIRLFGESQKYPNEYLFDFFGVDKSKLYIKNEAIQKVKWDVDKNAEPKWIDAYTFSFNIFDKQGNINKMFSFSVKDIIKKYLSNSIHYSLAPSQYIKELANNNSLNATPVGNIEGKAREYGIYTYGQSREDMLFASSYIPVVAKSGREIFEYNKYYADKKWVDMVEKGEQITNKDGSKTTIKGLKKIIIEYSGAIDSSTFINQSFASFMNGTLSQVDYSQLSSSQKEKLYGEGDIDQLIANSEKNGVQVTKKVNISSLTSRMVWQANPLNGTPNYLFNDIYSRLVYGSTSDELKQGIAKTANSFYVGDGFKFRLLIQASINWNQFIQQAYTNTRDVWLSGAAQNAIFCSTDDKSKTPFDYNELGMNDLIWFDENGTKHVVTLKEMKRLSNMTTEEIKNEFGEEAANNIAFTKLRSPKFKAIQSAMKKLLDDFYSKNKINAIEKIEWEIAYPFADKDETKTNATKEIVVNVINQLDPRINAVFKEPQSRAEMLSSINQRKGAFNANLWSYDYEGIGSFLAAFTSDGGGINIVNAIGIFSKEPDTDNQILFDTNKGRISKEEIINLQKNFPNFTELSKYVRKNMNILLKLNNASVDEKLLVENWDLITNEQNNHINSFFGLEGSSHYSNQNTINPNNVSPVATLPALYKAFETEARWQKNSKDANAAGQGWANLICELNAIKGVSIDTESSVAKLEDVNYTLFLREYIVPLSKYGLQMYSDIRYKEK